MPRETYSLTCQLPDRDRVREFIAKCGNFRGQYTFTAKPSRLSISQQQRGYYHGHVVKVFADFIEGTGQPLPELFDTFHDFAHAILKQRCLLVPIADRRTGEVTGHVVGSTTLLDSAGMGDYIERCRKYMWDKFELFTDEADPNWRMNRKALPEPATAGVLT